MSLMPVPLPLATGPNIDLSEDRRREQRLRLQRAVIDNMAGGVVLCSVADGRVVYANARYEAMLGYGAGELMGQHGSVVNSPAEADPQEVAQAMVAELQRDGVWHGTVRNRRKDGRDIWCRVAITTFEHDELGTVWVNVCDDITESHLAQLARDQAHAELHRLAARIQETLEAERADLSRDLHDQLGAALTGMRLRLEALASHPAALADTGLAAEIGAIAAMAQAATVQTREICSRLRPPALDDLGIVETCRWYLGEWARSSGVRVRRRLRRLPGEPAPGVAIDLFRILQELLTNVARHAAASRVSVELVRREGWLVLRVADDGVGFVPGAATGGFGLLGVRERAMRHGGELTIRSGPGGSAISVGMPQAGAS